PLPCQPLSEEISNSFFFKAFKQLTPSNPAASAACPSEVVRILQPSAKLSTTNFPLFQNPSVSTYSTD
ncbi:hypothetical protein, partial [Marinobacter koreensis]|uniref:hypothetical protein n=1 Tax=Marinobacter koreensis TaxID=335974 RepID=UPI002005ECEA